MNKKAFRYDIPIRILLTIILVGVLCFICFCQNTLLSWFGNRDFVSATSGEFKVCFFDVGQGDSSLIEYKDTTILIDAGPEENATNLCKNIKGIFGAEIDYFILTHADSDHVGGGEAIFENFDVKNFYRPKMLSGEEIVTGNMSEHGVHDTKAYNAVISASYQENCSVNYNEKGIILEDSNFILEIMYPISDENLKINDSNSHSAVIRAKYLDNTYLFMADADYDIEEKMVEKYATELDCDVLKVAHHGSRSASSEEFLDLVTPTYAVISVGALGIQDYGHAGDELKGRLVNAGAIIFQTNENGNILFGSNCFKSIVTFEDVPKVPIAVASAVIGLLVLITWGTWLPKRTKKIRNRILL